MKKKIIYQQLLNTKILHLAQVTCELLDTWRIYRGKHFPVFLVFLLFLTFLSSKALCTRQPFHLNQFSRSNALEENIKINSPQTKSPLCQLKANGKLPSHTKEQSSHLSTLI